MAGSRRPSRATTRKSRPRYEEVDSSEEDDYSKTNAHSGKDDDDGEDRLPPGVACARCHSKKVKCDGSRPYCLRNEANREEDEGSSDGGSDERH